jgi:hypothetical protein
MLDDENFKIEDAQHLLNMRLSKVMEGCTEPKLLSRITLLRHELDSYSYKHMLVIKDKALRKQIYERIQ